MQKIIKFVVISIIAISSLYVVGCNLPSTSTNSTYEEKFIYDKPQISLFGLNRTF